MNRMTEAEVMHKVTQIIAKNLRIDPSRASPASRLDADLGADSLDLVGISMEIESEFNVWMPEKDILQTARERFGAEVLEKDGVLTEIAKRLVQHRMPPDSARELPAEISVADLRGYFMEVRTWAHLVHGLLQHTPENCASCGGELAAGNGLRMKCKQCGAEIALPSGDELSREWVNHFYDTEYKPLLEQQTPKDAAPCA